MRTTVQPYRLPLRSNISPPGCLVSHLVGVVSELVPHTERDQQQVEATLLCRQLGPCRRWPVRLQTQPLGYTVVVVV